MRFLVDLDKVTVVLADVADARKASVVVASPPNATAASDATVHRLADVLAATNVGTLEADGTARLRADAVLFHAAGQVDADWERRFAEACEERRGGAVLGAPATVIWPSTR
ncbi:MAG TPA: hypothetical protein VMD28_07970 [Acidimicrobiales bacterium]|nr:hypothetical protein [Acidimicrobiales bacterium]